MRNSLAVTLCALVALGVGGGAGAQASAARCRPTVPGPAPVRLPGVGPDDFNYGNARLRAQLYWPRGTLAAGVRPDGGAMAIVDPGGSISAKLGWWRGTAGRLTIRGRRLDGAAPPLVAHASDGYGPRGFQPSGLTFPTTGCWRVVGSVGTARLTFVVRVTKLPGAH